MELKINLWNNNLTCNYFSTSFDRKYIEYFYLYLSLIFGRITKDDPEIKDLLNSGIIYDYG